MTFGANTVEYDGVFAGEAPQLSSSYAKYDNGGSVFNYYDNFLGSSLDSGWAENSVFAAYVAVSNGLQVQRDGWVVTTRTFMPLDNYTEASMQLTVSNTGSSAQDQIGYNQGASVTAAPSCSSTNTLCSSISLGNGATTGSTGFYTANGVSSSFLTGPSFSTTTYYTWGYGTIPGTAYVSFNGGSSSSSSYVMNVPAVFMVNAANFQNAVMEVEWFRIRTIPPNDIMPSISLGSVA
jgi:hypothetical protein